MTSTALRSRFARLSSLLAMAALAPRTASAESPAEPRCAPVVRFDDTVPRSHTIPANGMKVVPQNAPAIPFSVSTNSSDTAGLAKGTMFLAPTWPAPGAPSQRTALTLSASPNSFIGLVALPGGMAEGPYDLSFEAPCIVGAPDSVTAERTIVIGPSKPFPTTLGSAKVTFDSGQTVQQGVAIRTSVYKPSLNAAVVFTPSPEFAAFASVAHLDLAIVPNAHGGNESRPLGFQANEAGSLTFDMRPLCLNEGPARLRISGGVYGQADLAPLEFEVGNCTAEDVAATKDSMVGESGCSASGRPSGSSSVPMLVAGALAFMGVQLRRRRSESSKRPGC